MKPTILFSTNRDVDKLNEEELNNLSGESKSFDALDEGPHKVNNCYVIEIFAGLIYLCNATLVIIIITKSKGNLLCF